MNNMISASKGKFIDTLKTIKKSQQISTTFNDFVLATSLKTANVLLEHPFLDMRFFAVMTKYSDDDIEKFKTLLEILIEVLNNDIFDFLGYVHREIEQESEASEYFSEDEDDLTKRFEKNIHNLEKQLKEMPYFLIQISANTAIQLVKLLASKGINPHKQVLIEVSENNTELALMAYLQLSLLSIPAEVVVTDDDSENQVTDSYRTPAYFALLYDDVELAS